MPAPIAMGAFGSSGQRGRGLKSNELLYPDFNLSNPAHAIIAALSVQNSGGGTRSWIFLVIINSDKRFFID